MDLVINSSITHSALLVLPIVVAALLRWARVPGWPVVGGAIAGLVLGPTILGRLAPEMFEALFVGGVHERETLTGLVGRQQADRIAAGAAGLDQLAMLEMAERHREELVAPEAALRNARWGFQRPFRSYSSALIVLTLAGAALARRRTGGAPGGLVTVSVGLWSAAVPGALACAAAMWWWRADPAAGLLTGAAVAIGPWLLTASDADAADQAELGGARRIELAGRIATVVALAGAGVGLARALGPLHALWGLPLLASIVGWIALPLTDTSRTIARGILDYALIPSLTACVAIRFDAILHFALGPVVLIAILSGDGRWLGAFLGAMLPGGRRGLRTMRLVLGAMSCGPTQLAIASVAAHLDVVEGETVFALLVGAVVIEMTAPARRSVARRLAATEEELDEL